MKWYCTAGRLGTVTVAPERKLEGDRRGPCAYLVGVTPWMDGPDVIDTDKFTGAEIREFQKVWPDVTTFKTEVKITKDKDGAETSTTEQIPFTESIWKAKVEEWIGGQAGLLHLVEGVPVQPVRVDNLSREELDSLTLKRQEKALAGEITYAPPVQKVKIGQRTV